ncbi:transmembrane protein [Arabidopsis thaliana]|uniref:Transmembrane protein n=1 Tax=Arabidopsis thaliana TaxID=3702 RepID=A0A1I9LNI2_ARATH|nr:uncharacterized protein AT3G44700 [Arabidopsis thaliana]ANM64140.1 transmembrane protein [Arabidopsis thaliana]|eukprot:NP_001326187.1 transmembrane protein [Arabidopsis thaliana]
MNHREEAKRANNDEDNGGIDIVVEKSHDLISGGSVPKLLKKSAGGEKCCIFRIHQRLRNNNYKDAYEPRVLSIGPYHHGKEHLQMIQEHKHRFLGIFMDEAQKKGVDMKDLIEAVSELEEDIRESYSESLYNARKVSYPERVKDPIFGMKWILTAKGVTYYFWRIRFLSFFFKLFMTNRRLGRQEG